MQHLPEKWLRRFNYLYIVYFLVLFGLYVYSAVEQKTFFITPVPTLGLNMGVALMAFAGLVYNSLILRPVKKYNLWLGYVISYALISLANSMAVETVLPTKSAPIFMGITYALSLLSVTLGPICGIVIIAISGIIVGMIVAGTTTPTRYGQSFDTTVFVIRAIVISGAIYLLRHKYIDEGSRDQNYIAHNFVKNDIVQLLTDSISDGVIIIDQHGVIKSVNAGATRLFGMAQPSLVEIDYKRLLLLKTLQNDELSNENDPVTPAIKHGKHSGNEFILSRRHGSDLYVDITVSPIMNEGTKTIYGAVIIVRDVNKRKREEAARSEFINTASHEMRTPVAAIAGYLELALSPTSGVPPQTRAYLAKAYTSTKHLGRLFQDLLTSAKAEDGRLTSHPEVIEMNEFLSRLSDDFKVIARQKGLELEFLIGTDETAKSLHLSKPFYYVFADPDRLREVITNLFDNAVKYTEKGKVTLGLTGNGSLVQFFIRDTGRGIPRENIPQLFQKFYRVDNSDTRSTGGTGLGLFLCKKILELYKGTIWVESEVAKGSTFYANLPRLSNDEMQSLLDKQLAANAPIQHNPEAKPALHAAPQQPVPPASPSATPTQPRVAVPNSPPETHPAQQNNH